MRIFKLVETYECFLDQVAYTKLVRVEVLEAINESGVFRARVWLQNTYNLYPTFLNIGPQGEDLRALHSSDQISTEITTLIAKTPELITGIHKTNAKEVLELAMREIFAWSREL